MTASTALDVITIGRASVDLYGQQIGGRLEDMASFSKAVGGCPANIAIGTARLGLRSALITRVGHENFGRFIREQLERESVCTDGVITDPARLTALAILGVRDQSSFPLLFYRTDCADNALEPDDIDPAFVARAGALVVTGTHFARPHTAAAQRKAMRLMRDQGGRIIFDVDYRPNLWGLSGIGDGENRYVRSAQVTQDLAPILAECDLIVGTEEELHIAGGHEDTLDAIRAIRALSQATIVCKRGPMGCVAFDGAIPNALEDGITGPGFPVDVYNTLGAGDAFMSGFLRGWLRNEPLETCCTYANACGAFAVSRLLCSSEIPTWPELQHFLVQGSTHRALRHDTTLNHLHWATTRPVQATPIMALACDHRLQLEEMARQAGAPFDRIAGFKRLAVEAALHVANGAPGFGLFMDGRYGQDALFRASHAGLWTARPIEKTGSRPLDFESGGSLGAHMTEWPSEQVAKCLCFYRPDDSEDLRARQIRELQRAQDACRRQGRDLLIEIIAGRDGPLAEHTVADALSQLYEAGLKPDWWKLEGQDNPAAWRAIGAVIDANDPLCRGIVILGLDAPAEQLIAAFEASTATPWVKGFAIGRTIFSDAARAWLAGSISDEAAIAQMSERFGRFVNAWRARGSLRAA
ncbi:ribokinase family sugar kinase [Ameyamaea chiangmaiensis NBRC 103196]|uniref:5-dehydro-2-deoxygluconokinase n=1 Tax=Ameyamaea chiangmaiensis TaxID=442969 RepID=A0A850PFZ6_9PROT|nr:5-dehydro-2-deoxygluconokinase [Ameyamaea chiangmaiensis]MBS4075029.1 5-dehydro-2-deoxygluconokinase [Ameyamaea chiangmaiensis]NVN40071.1 5-dehydro-2-deoxygluconokinase [Ameyamaea chiangmaiensis]GBQ65719.1 ribokinase family sugar kinase [Ameyamaea chiangmaiensis NBRC 103196]